MCACIAPLYVRNWLVYSLLFPIYLLFMLFYLLSVSCNFKVQSQPKLQSQPQVSHFTLILIYIVNIRGLYILYTNFNWSHPSITNDNHYKSFHEFWQHSLALRYSNSQFYKDVPCYLSPLSLTNVNCMYTCSIMANICEGLIFI